MTTPSPSKSGLGKGAFKIVNGVAVKPPVNTIKAAMEQALAKNPKPPTVFNPVIANAMANVKQKLNPAVVPSFSAKGGAPSALKSIVKTANATMKAEEKKQEALRKQKEREAKAEEKAAKAAEKAAEKEAKAIEKAMKAAEREMKAAEKAEKAAERAAKAAEKETKSKKRKSDSDDDSKKRPEKKPKPSPKTNTTAPKKKKKKRSKYVDDEAGESDESEDDDESGDDDFVVKDGEGEDEDGERGDGDDSGDDGSYSDDSEAAETGDSDETETEVESEEDETEKIKSAVKLQSELTALVDAHKSAEAEHKAAQMDLQTKSASLDEAKELYPYTPTVENPFVLKHNLLLKAEFEYDQATEDEAEKLDRRDKAKATVNKKTEEINLLDVGVGETINKPNGKSTDTKDSNDGGIIEKFLESRVFTASNFFEYVLKVSGESGSRTESVAIEKLKPIVARSKTIKFSGAEQNPDRPFMWYTYPPFGTGLDFARVVVVSIDP